MKYNKITNEELSLLKNEILNNSSFSEIGRKLDLSTGTVKRIIEEYKIDYYLGQKIIIEVQGKYWHNNNNKIHLEKDKKKKKCLENLGYNIIYISEDDLKNKKEEIVKNILKMLVKNILI